MNMFKFFARHSAEESKGVMHSRKCHWALSILICVLLPAIHAVPALAQLEDYTFKLTQSTAAYQFWTTPPAERVFQNDAVPSDTGSEVKVYLAKNEFEPFQVVVKPNANGNVNVNIGNFGSGITAEIYQVKYVNITQATDSLGRTGPYPDPLWPLQNGATVSLNANRNTSFWFNVHVPSTTAAGEYTANVTIGGVNIPVRLHVFNFAIPEELHVKSQMNFSHGSVLSKYGVSGTGAEYWSYVDNMKQFFIDHRLTPKNTLWSGGLTSSGGYPYIDYDCNSGLSDPHGIWGFDAPAARYLGGTGLMGGNFSLPFNGGTGFPSFMAVTFQNNDPSADQRPSTFCGQSRTAADWYGANNPNSAYNQKWFQYIAAIRNYLSSTGYLEKSHYYFANEPQDQADYDAVAWYSRHLKSAAPNLKLMVSEEAKPEIYNHPDYVASGQIDTWMAAFVSGHYDPAASQDREKNHGEETWLYFLHSTRPPYFNPITLDHPGIESKFTGWLLWKYRVRGLAYYSLNNWSKNPWTDPMTDSHNGDLFMLYPPSETNSVIAYGSNNHRFVPSIRFELMRDSLEDYEYLYLLNGNARPEVGVSNSADGQVDKIILSLTSYTRDSEFMYNLRRLIGQKLGGEISTIPNISPPAVHPRSNGAPGNYYINFQDPSGNPTANPLVVNGKEYMKIGWNAYNESLGYGWFGDMAHVMSQYLSSGPNVLQRSILYDDWGRQKTFEFDLPNGTYNVTVSVGWQGRTYAHNKIDIEGVSFVNDEATQPYLVRTKQLTISDYKLTMDMGIFNEYTMLNYLEIEAVGPEMSVSQGGTEIPHTSGSYDFGAVDAGSQSSVTFSIQNSGQSALVLDGNPVVTIAGLHAADFTVASYPAGLVGPGASATFQVQFAPQGTGLRSATISIANNDADENPYTFTMTGSGNAVAGLSLDYGNTGTVIDKNKTSIWHPLTFSGSFGSAPVFVADLQTNWGGEPAELRMQNLTGTGVEIKIEEDKSLDNENNHLAEDVGYLAVAPGVLHNATGEAIGEAGSVQAKTSADSDWDVLTFLRSYTKPVVRMQIATFGGAAPVHVRLRNVNASGLEFQLEEWDHDDQFHGWETVNYVVVEAGDHALPNNIRLVADTVNISADGSGLFTKVLFSPVFAAAPVVLSQSQTYNDPAAIVTRQKDILANRVKIRLVEEEAADQIHGSETVGYLAIGTPTAGDPVSPGTSPDGPPDTEPDKPQIPTVSPDGTPAVTPVPEPSTLGLLVLGALGLAALRRKRL